MTKRPEVDGADCIYVFTHIQKAGGTTVEALMRRRFGLRHMVVQPVQGWTYRRKDLAADLRLNPFARSICSHWLRPFTGFGEFEPRLGWYTMLRDPLDRFRSHYQYHVERMGARKSFAEWIRNPVQHNLQTRLLAGEQDLEAAKQVLAARYRCVGLMERFDESLLLIRERLGIARFRAAYARPHNTARSEDWKERLREEFELVRDDCVQSNAMDIELYAYAVNTLYARQVAEYGEQRLRTDLSKAFVAGQVSSTREIAREAACKAFQRAIYTPALALRRAIAARERTAREW